MSAPPPRQRTLRESTSRTISSANRYRRGLPRMQLLGLRATSVAHPVGYRALGAACLEVPRDRYERCPSATKRTSAGGTGAGAPATPSVARSAVDLLPAKRCVSPNYRQRRSHTGTSRHGSQAPPMSDRTRRYESAPSGNVLPGPSDLDEARSSALASRTRPLPVPSGRAEGREGERGLRSPPGSWVRTGTDRRAGSL
jgi:hypothetical protein